MALTLGGGPLDRRAPHPANYRVDGPDGLLFWAPFPRRVRALFGGETVLDTERGMLLHESGLLPQLYVPRADLREDLLTPTAHRTRCPFKGEAHYETVRVGGHTAENAVWSYPEPVPGADWLAGHSAVYGDRMDAWFDEDEEVFGHLRDPYHRVDVRAASRSVRVTVHGVEVAASRRALVLSETGLPNRYYLPEADVRTELLVPSATHTVCPYKGTASYRAVRAGDVTVPDAVWYYPEPLPGARRIAGHLCFLAEGVRTEVDGTALA
ncbi:DUF427 domain-containing protein [Streptomyces sp. JJ36]|uniref:DUF427 domain-containing protein n=1 Tax=Streptomyces sp. JJ36 TaxID=2736645 RepID=UPI001F274CC6|nr:DUF427 domain-containing protein [Streptomyces sp. JJ36]MCF6522860.1 DUF427 domain-containing protein [Streptomyces sp. JJ36]